MTDKKPGSVKAQKPKTSKQKQDIIGKPWYYHFQPPTVKPVKEQEKLK